MSGRLVAATAENNFKFHQATSNIAGTAEGLKRKVKQLDAELKEDLKGKKEFEDYLTKLNLQKADIQGRIEKNKTWIENFEANSDNGAFEAQYRGLLEEIQQIYESAKEFHGKGIDMLINEFGYHIAYKRWNDTFSAVPFKPK
ncbi:hypothetical protein OEZ85_008213 [Tetradesmus obliquus]|uniref:Flagellar associated protein n=1 Tax=Tetradesmus obliquus TaxID=3088 RepID=A0ABY8TLT0_TETOB|nr:hypothetical protein OEZ85_008213 [Tetradesmus obliquus]